MSQYSIWRNRPRSGVHPALLRSRPVYTVLVPVLFLLTLLQPLQAQASTPPPSHLRINAQQVRQYLKHAIHVQHTGHALQPVVPPRWKKKRVPVPKHAQPAFNNIGISDDSNWAMANFDGSGASYSAQALQNVGLAPDVTITVNDIPYLWPDMTSGSADNYQASGQVLQVAPQPNAARVGLLGAAVDGASSGTATLTFTDGTTQTFTLGLSDWTLTAGSVQPSFGNTTAATMPYRNTSTNQQTVTTYLFTAEQALPQGKTLQSVTLPATTTPGTLHIFAVGLSGPAFNNTAISDDAHTSSANYDGTGASYSLQALQGADLSPGQTFSMNGVSFSWPAPAAGQPDSYQAAGQVLPVTPVDNATTLAFLGSSTYGAASGTATISYDDGSTQTFTLGFADWQSGSTTSLPYGNSVAATMSYHNSASGKQTQTVYLFYTEVALQANKNVVTVTLPATVSQGALHVFAIGTRASLYTNLGTSNDSQTGSGNFDGGHSSYSLQALQAANILPGQSFTFNGATFVWPVSAGFLDDNMQVSGQTIPVTPVPNATAVAFVGASTNGNTSGTATLTYTDGSTQTFTLGLTDWWNSTPQTGNQTVAQFPYINTPTGKRTGTFSLYEMETPLQAGKTLQSVTLPTTASPGQLHIFAVGTHSAYNNIGISDNSNSRGANFDTTGSSYSAEDFSDPNGPGWNPGDTLTYNGMNLVWPNVPAGAGDNYQAQGQTIPVNPVASADTLGFVGAATNGGTTGSSGTATITYTDGSTQTFTLGFSDWMLNGGTAAPTFNNWLFAALPHRNTPGGQQAVTTYLFYTQTTLQAGKTVQSVTLPTTVSQGQLHVFMIGTRAGNTFMNNVGTSDDGNSGFANYDGNGGSYSIEALEGAGIHAGQPFSTQGVSFVWPASYSVIPDNYQAAGQTIAVTPVSNATTLAFLGSATYGPSAGTATITYTDGSTQTFTLGFADWTVNPTSSLPYGDIVAATMSYRNSYAATIQGPASVFYTAVTLTAGKTIQSVTLPATVTQGSALHVFAVGTK